MAFEADTRYAYGAVPPIIEDHISNLRFKLSDDNIQDADNKLQIPTSETSTYSFWKQVYLYMSLDSNASANNIGIYGSDLNWVDITIWVAQITHYARAGGIAGETGYFAEDSVNGHTDLKGTSLMVDLSAYTSSSPLSLTGGLGAGQSGSAIDGYLLLQLEIIPGANPQVLSPKYLVWRYDLV